MRNKKFSKLLFCLMLALSVSACASIVSHRNYPVSVTSEPPGARFVITDAEGRPVHDGITPDTITLVSRSGYFSRAHYKVAFELDGYPASEVHLIADMDGWYWGNILIGGLIGMLIVDPITGAMWKLPPEVAVTFGPDPADEGLTLLTRSQLPEDLHAQLIPIQRDPEK